MLDALDDELCDLLPTRDRKRLGGVEVDRDDLDLSAVVRVDKARSVDEGQPALECESTTGLNEAGVTLGYRDRDTRRDECALRGASERSSAA